MTNSYVAIMIAMLGKLPSTLATSSSYASRRPTACTSSLTLGRDLSSSQKSSAHLHIDSSGVTGKEYPTLGTWSIYDDSIRIIVLNSSYVFLFLVPFFFRLNKKIFQAVICYESSTTSSFLMLPPPPLDMLGGLAKANIWVARPGVLWNLSQSFPSTYSGAWHKANPRVIPT
jgi:hypothetical protein